MNEASPSPVRGPTRFRKLRIAWSVGWGLLAVLLIVLWAGSYWWTYWIIHERGPDYAAVGIIRGIACIRCSSLRPDIKTHDPQGWRVQSCPASNIYGEFFSAFKWNDDPRFIFGVLLDLNCWCWATFFAALSAAPWIRWRFSLRTLLIATTLIAVVLGVVVWVVKS